jgi:hypothetical protein
MNDKLVNAIRSDDKIGRGTDSFIEYYTDGELKEDLSNTNVKTAEDAVKWAIRRDTEIKEFTISRRLQSMTLRSVR